MSGSKILAIWGHVAWIGQQATCPWSMAFWALQVGMVASMGMLSQARDMGGWGQESGILVSTLLAN